ncbi:MAG: 30S ribosomal protein S6 [Candidatus Omnitrophica bacterium]|nr:30S ribosomal protein S6 [Candidatus Omnitrophota bacterium]MCM8770485.1 30S ribosomal protein S6 [Candidatus Omnitrophota bacterium]
MRKYEALFMVKPDLNEGETKNLFQQINDTITKNNGQVLSSGLYGQEKRKLCFPIKKFQEAIYYLVEFALEPPTINKIKAQYRLNEGILRFLILVKD